MLTPRTQPPAGVRTWRPTTPAGTSVLIVESDRSVVETIASYLMQEGFDIRVATDGSDGLAEFCRQRPELVLLGLSLTGISGLDLCKRIRTISDVPIIAMSSAGGTEVDAVVALEMGADDFIPRSCRMRELVARLRAALRRAPQADPDGSRGVLRAGPLTLDRSRCEVTVDGARLNLPRKEYRLLEVLLEHPGRVFSRRTLISRVWGEDYVGTTKTLDVHIRRLRSKLEVDATVPQRIVTVRGLGFKYEPPPRSNVTPLHPEVAGGKIPLKSGLVGADTPDGEDVRVRAGP
ncbi:MAG TPA: response regulator transcription factor [Acidimicrobiales bacterium]